MTNNDSVIGSEHRKDNVMYPIDLVLCQDVSGATRALLSEMQDIAENIMDLVSEAMASQCKQLDTERFRVKSIIFRDFRYDSEPIKETPFYRFNDLAEKEAFCCFISNVYTYGGGDEPESGLEALASAIRCNWTPQNTHSRQIIVLLTDGDCHEYGDPESLASPLYPKDMPESLSDLLRIWEEGDSQFAPRFNPQKARLILVAPAECDTWQRIALWNRTWFIPVRRGYSCSDLDFSELFRLIAGSC